MQAFLLKVMECMLNYFNIHRIQAFVSLFQFKFHGITFSDFINQAGNVHKVLFARAVFANEAKSFGVIEKFYFTFIHLEIIY